MTRYRPTVVPAVNLPVESMMPPVALHRTAKVTIVLSLRRPRAMNCQLWLGFTCAVSGDTTSATIRLFHRPGPPSRLSRLSGPVRSLRLLSEQAEASARRTAAARMPTGRWKAGRSARGTLPTRRTACFRRAMRRASLKGIWW